MTTDTAITTTVNPYDEYAEDTDAGEERGGVGLPLLRLNGQTGAFLDVEADVEYKTGCKVIPLLRLGATRVMFPPGDASDDAAGPDCASDDNLQPRDPAQAAALGAGPLCGNCAFGQWIEEEDGTRKPPQCREVIHYAVVLIGEDGPALVDLPVKGSSIKPLREVWQKLGPKATRERRPVYSYLLNLSATPQGTGKRRYYQLAADLSGDAVPPSEMPMLRDCYQQAQALAWQDRATLARQQRARIAPQNALPAAAAPTQAALLEPSDLPLVPEGDRFDADGFLVRVGPAGEALSKATPAQVNAIVEMAADRLGLDDDGIKGLAQEKYGYEPGDLTREEASEMIGWLQTQKRARRG